MCKRKSRRIDISFGPVHIESLDSFRKHKRGILPVEQDGGGQTIVNMMLPGGIQTDIKPEAGF